MNKSYFLSVLLFTLLALPFVAYAHCDGKHSGDHPHCGGEEPPPPPPPTESCADAAGSFPAFAYTKQLNDGKHGTWSGSELYLADSTGTCSIKIFTLDYRSPMEIDYRQIGEEGRIVWTQQSSEENLKGKGSNLAHPVLKLLDFTVSAGVVSDVSHTVAWRDSFDVGYRIADVALSPDASTAYIAVEDYEENRTASLHSIDLSICNLECGSQLIQGSIIQDSTGNDQYFKIAMGISESRLYFSSRFALGFIDLSNATIRYIHKFDPDLFPGFPSLGPLSVGQLSSGNEAVAITSDEPLIDFITSIDIIDVGTCNANGQTSDCLSTGESTVIASGIAGWYSTFFSDSWLLVDGQGDINIVDINTLTNTPYIFGGDHYRFPDSAE